MGVSAPSAAAVSARSARNEATRVRLSEVAINLFAEHGYEQTTAAQIAAAAGVTERTFFNHFETKLDAVYPRREYTSFATVRAMVAGVPLEISALDAACDCSARWLLQELGEDPSRHHRTGRLRLQISATSPSVLGIRAQSRHELIDALTMGLAARHGRVVPIATEEVLGLVVGTVADEAWVKWLECDDLGGYEQIVTERLALLRSVFSG